MEGTVIIEEESKVTQDEWENCDTDDAMGSGKVGMLSPIFKEKVLPSSVSFGSLSTVLGMERPSDCCLIDTQQKRKGKEENWRMRKGAFRLRR